MSLGSSLAQARRKSGRTQEEAAEKLGVSRQTISKWELDETLPDINQSKKLAVFYHLTLDQLIGFDVEAAELERLLNEFLHSLPERECNVFLRRYWYVEEYNEIAKRYGMKLNTVKTCLFRTRAKLRSYLEEEGVIV